MRIKEGRFGKIFNKFGFVIPQTSDMTCTNVQLLVFQNIAIPRWPKPRPN